MNNTPVLTTKKMIRVTLGANFFESLAQSKMTFGDAVNELVDNAISNPNKGEMAIVAIGVYKEGDNIRVIIADYGRGMDHDRLIKALTEVGSSQDGDEGFLCYYGIGHKGAITAMTHGTLKCYVASRRVPREQRGTFDKYNIFVGPYANEVEVGEGELPCAEIFKNLKLTRQYGYPNTVVSFQTTKAIVSTILTSSGRADAKKANDMHAIKMALAEHLGITYRGFIDFETKEDGIKRTDAEIYILNFFENIDEPRRLSAIWPEEKSREVAVSSVVINGHTVPFRIECGLLDKSQMNKAVAGASAPKYHYLGNQATQGIDIMIGGRTIATAQMDSIWPIARHPQWNQFTGYIRIDVSKLPRRFIPTLANKSGIDPSNPVWVAIFSKVRKLKDIRPRAAKTFEEYIKEAGKQLEKEGYILSPKGKSTGSRSYLSAQKIDYIAEKKGKPHMFLYYKNGNIEALKSAILLWDTYVHEYPELTIHIVCGKQQNKLKAAFETLNNRFGPSVEVNGKRKNIKYNFVLTVDKEMPDSGENV